jgi:hypothetical protein
VESKRGTIHRVKYWEIIADNLSKSGWSWGCVATVDREGRTIFVADAHRGDGKRFVVRADEKLTAFLELERVTRDDDYQNQDRTVGKRERTHAHSPVSAVQAKVAA